MSKNKLKQLKLKRLPSVKSSKKQYINNLHLQTSLLL